MADQVNCKLTRFMDAAFGRLLGILPSDLRNGFGTDIMQLYSDCAHEALALRGLRGYLHFWLRAVGDLLRTALSDHIEQLRLTISSNKGGAMKPAIHAEGHEFGQELSAVLEAEPAYYPVIVSVQPTRDICEVAESIALEGDMTETETALHLFKELSDQPPAESVERWLDRLCLAAQRHYENAPAPESTDIIDQLLHRIYADAELFSLIAVTDVGSSIFEIVESLALEGNIDEIEPMLAMMQRLAR